LERFHLLPVTGDLRCPAIREIPRPDSLLLITTRIPLPKGLIAFRAYICGNPKRDFSHTSMDTISPAALREEEFADESVSLEKVYVRTQAVVSRRIAGETLIVPVRGKVGDLASIYSFNATGSLLWQALESSQNLAGLIDVVQGEYAVEREQAERDVKQFLQDTVSVGLVEVREQVSMSAMNVAMQAGMHSTSSR
jgi:hypothetical protein